MDVPSLNILGAQPRGGGPGSPTLKKFRKKKYFCKHNDI